jgi:formylglycine-generating enzyme required for sulfatase activity
MQILEWVGPFLYAIATLYLLFRQNQIMAEQNEIMRQESSSTSVAESAQGMGKGSAKTYWPMLVMVAMMLLTWGALGYYIYSRHAITVSPEPLAGEGRQSGNSTLSYIWVPSGKFMMGCAPGDKECLPEELPLHSVTISHGFWIGQTEVTVGAYKKMLYRSGKQMPPDPPFNRGWQDDNLPIVNVTWKDADWFCKLEDGHLPSEAEWEYGHRM